MVSTASLMVHSDSLSTRTPTVLRLTLNAFNRHSYYSAPVFASPCAMHFRSQLLVAVTLFVAVCIAVHAYPSGSPKCSAHIPKHGSTKAQTSKSPFKVATSAVTKNKDGKSTVTVTISGSNDTKFKGFFLYASSVGSNDKIGKFSDTDKSTVLKCGSSVSFNFVGLDNS